MRYPAKLEAQTGFGTIRGRILSLPRAPADAGRKPGDAEVVRPVVLSGAANRRRRSKDLFDDDLRSESFDFAPAALRSGGLI